MKKPKIILMLAPMAREVEVEMQHLPQKGDTIHYAKVEFEVQDRTFVFESNIIRLYCFKK